MSFPRLIVAAVAACGLYQADDTAAPPEVPPAATWGTERDAADPYRICVDNLVAVILRDHPDIGRPSAVAIAESACLRRTDINL